MRRFCFCGRAAEVFVGHLGGEIMSGYTHFTVKPLSGSVGAILGGIDISRDLSSEELA